MSGRASSASGRARRRGAESETETDRETHDAVCAVGTRAGGPPSRPGARSCRSAAGDKRERILRAAIKVFARKGFYATRVSEIAKAAGVADGTIYLYFENKDAVLVSIFEDRISRLLEVLRREIDAAPTFDERISRIVMLQLGQLEGQRDLAEVITVNLRQSSRLLKQYAAPLFTEYLDTLAGVVADGQREGVVRPDAHPRILARALYGALDGVALTWALGGAEPGTLVKAAHQIVALFLDGIRARERTPTTAGRA
jgi:TetR/AcrR family fatty acid metabolism transcriptional regulator